MNALSHTLAIVTANRTGAGERIKLDDVPAAAEQIEAWILR